MRVNPGQGSLLQVMAAIAVVSVLLLILFVTQSTSSAETLIQHSQQSKATMTSYQLETFLSTTYYMPSRNNINIGALISKWCEYGLAGGLDGQSVNKRDYIQNTLDYIITSDYRLTITCQPNDPASTEYTIGTFIPDEGEVYADSERIPDSTNNVGTIAVRLQTWN